MNGARRGGRRFAAALALCIVGTEGLAQQATVPPLSVVRPSGDRVSWRGIPPDELAGSQGAMLYPAPSAVGLLAAIFTHAAIVQGGREAERRSRQQAADKVLEPFAATLAEMSPSRLTDEALRKLEVDASKKVVDSAASADAAWILEMQPSFSMAPDQRTVVLDNAVRLYPLGQSNAPLFANIVRVISAPAEPMADAPTAPMTGEALQEESAQMLAHSIEVVLSRATQDVQRDGAFKTQRYRFGENEKMERGVPVATGCGRVILRTLREWLMSVPVQADAGAPACSHRYRLTKPDTTAGATAATGS